MPTKLLPLVVVLPLAVVAGVVINSTTGGANKPVLPRIPGAINRHVVQSNIQSTICKAGWTATIRPPQAYTHNAKVIQIKQYGYSDTLTSHYQEDHLISLELGGSPTSYNNLWPQPIVQAHRDDKLENQWRVSVCDGHLTLSQGRKAERTYKEKNG